MAAASIQNVVRDLIYLLRARGLRHANISSAGIDRVFKFTNGTTPAGGKTWYVIEVDDAKLAAGDEKMWGANVPDGTRV